MPRMIRSVTEIVDISESKNTPDRMAYKYLIQQVDKLLRARAIDQQYDAMFEVPAIVLFQPHFDRSLVAKKIEKHYVKMGFVCVLDGFQMTLMWGALALAKQEEDDESEEVSSSEEEQPQQRAYSSEEDKLPSPRKIVVDGLPSLTKRVASMKK